MGKHMFCTTCGYEGKVKKQTPGSFLIEVIMWLAFLVPGIIYSLWRITNKYFVCAKCRNKSVIPIDSPMALQHKRLLEK